MVCPYHQQVAANQHRVEAAVKKDTYWLRLLPEHDATKPHQALAKEQMPCG